MSSPKQVEANLLCPDWSLYLQLVCASQSMPHTSAFRIVVLCAVCAGERNPKANQNFSVQCGKIFAILLRNADLGFGGWSAQNMVSS